jgi:serine protease
MWMRLAILVLALSPSGCGSDADCQATGLVGSCCSDDADCGELTCLKDFPGGYCTRDCEADHTCPGDAQCLQMTGSFSGILCLANCGSARPDCRERYSCQYVGGVNDPVCVPGG